jgi:glycosyltransferase involved in cell wall biosynthesis
MGNEPGIRVHGFVADLFALAHGQGVMINPMVEGSGLKNKVLEAFALGLPVVSTTLGADAFGIEDGRHCRIADAPVDFASAVRDLLEQPAHAQRIASNARELVHRRFTWPAAGKALLEALEYAAGGSLRARAA